MTKEEILEGNKLIAEFMQLKKLMDTLWINPVLACSTDHLAYHESWGWIMPVIVKISEHRWPEYYQYGGKTDEDGDYDDCVYPRTFGMRDKEGNYMVRLNAHPLFTAPTLIEAVFNAVVYFIQDVNSLSKTNQ